MAEKENKRGQKQNINQTVGTKSRKNNISNWNIQIINELKGYTKTLDFSNVAPSCLLFMSPSLFPHHRKLCSVLQWFLKEADVGTKKVEAKQPQKHFPVQTFTETSAEKRFIISVNYL